MKTKSWYQNKKAWLSIFIGVILAQALTAFLKNFWNNEIFLFMAGITYAYILSTKFIDYFEHGQIDKSTKESSSWLGLD